MKKISQKLLVILIVFIIVFEFVCSNTVNAASSDINETILNSITNLAGGVVSIVFWKDRLFITGLTFVLNKIMEGVAKSSGSNPDFGDGSIFMTPYDVFFNKYAILGVNFFKINEEGLDQESITYKFRVAVSGWFYFMRTLASIILLVVLVYVGIRMAISTVAEDKAKYKKMLIDWVCSLALIFLLQYLAIGIIYVNDIIVKVLENVLADKNSIGTNISNIMGEFVLDAVVGIGITSMISTAVFCCIVAQTLFFFIAYLNRMIKVGFLIIISPLIAITYPIDKMGDGKAQALNNWLKEFAYTILIQPFHCIIYIALIHTAFKLTYEATGPITALANLNVPALLSGFKINKLANGVLTILCLKFVNDGEKVVRKIFGFADDNSKTSMAAGAIVAVAALKNAKTIGSTARKGINNVGNRITGLRDAVGSDSSKMAKYFKSDSFKNTKIGQFANGAQSKFNNLANGVKSSRVGTGARGMANFANQKARSISNKINNSRPITGAKSMAGKLRRSKAIRGLRTQMRQGLPRALGTMAMMMSYATGDTTLLSANAYGQGVRTGTEEFFNSSKESLASAEAENNNKQDEIERKELEDKIEQANDELSDVAEKLGLAGNITKEEAKNVGNSYEAERARLKAKSAERKLEEQRRRYKEAQMRANSQHQKVVDAQTALENAKTQSEKNIAQRNLNEELRKEQEKNDRAEKEKEKMEEAETRAEDLRDEANKFDNLIKAVNKIDNLEELKRNFDTAGARKIRLIDRANGASKTKLNAQKNEILQLILKLEEQINSASEVDINKEYTFSENDSDSAVKTTDNIIKAIDLAVLSGGASIEASDYIKNSTGLTAEGESTYKSLQKAINHYELLRRQAETAATYSKHASYNGDADKLQDRIYKRSYGSTES